MPTAVVTDHDFPDLDIERDVLADVATLRDADASTAAEVIEAAEDAEALLVQYAPITREVFDHLDDLRVVARYGVGVDNVDVAAAADHGVYVTNVPDYCFDEVSEHALALLLTCERKTALYAADLADGGWDWKVGKPIERLHGATLGLVGFGDIPRRLVEKVSGFDFEVLAYDPYVDAATFDEYGVEDAGFEDLLERSDVVSVHAPLTPETEGMVDADALARMKPDATLLNTARGGLVDVDALEDALEAGDVGAAGLDVLPEEPPGEERRSLLARDDVVATPHVGWYSEDSMRELRRRTAESVRTALRGEVPEDIVDAEVV
ncbi:MAG: C-terminal binding protein [Haloferacaceae archaeon]